MHYFFSKDTVINYDFEESDFRLFFFLYFVLTFVFFCVYIDYECLTKQSNKIMVKITNFEDLKGLDIKDLYERDRVNKRVCLIGYKGKLPLEKASRQEKKEPEYDTFSSKYVYCKVSGNAICFLQKQKDASVYGISYPVDGMSMEEAFQAAIAEFQALIAEFQAA